MDFAQGAYVEASALEEPQLGASPCFVDLDGDGIHELVTAGKSGIVTALNDRLVPIWRFDAGAPVEATPSGAPLFENQGAVFILSSDGRLHAISGQGKPLWFFPMERPAPLFPSLSEPLVVQLAYTYPSVLVSDDDGWLYAVDAVTGTPQWRRQAGRGALGTPAVYDVHPNEGREIVTVSEVGDIAILDATGDVLARALLPIGRYVPRPLVADIDGDGALELIVAEENWQIVIASLEGIVKAHVPLRGAARDGLVLGDVQGDGVLELLAATDCARLHCFETSARDGWLHPRGSDITSGAVLPLPKSSVPGSVRSTRAAPPEEVVLPEFTEVSPFATAWVQFGVQPKAASASIVIRQGQKILGSATRRLENNSLTAPIVRFNSDAITLDTCLYDDSGKVLAASEGIMVRPRVARPVALTPPEPFFLALDERAQAYAPPPSWALPKIAGRDSWHIAGYAPLEWEKSGIGDAPFIKEAAPRIATSAKTGNLFREGHPAWASIAADTKPFLVMNDYFRPEVPYPNDVVRAIEAMGGSRFLGFQVHEWAYHVWKKRWEGGMPRPESRSQAMSILEQDFHDLLRACHGRIYAGEGYCLFHHQAYAWGAPSAYAEVGEDIPCAPLQFAYLRGAARQFGSKPWGAYVSNWFRGAVWDGRFRADGTAVSWTKPNVAVGPACGHSPSLEFRLEMAAHLAGATFVHHESDTFNGSVFVSEPQQGQFVLSEHGQAIKRWYDYSRRYPERGVPYTPVAFMVDPNQGWRPREKAFGIWPLERAEKSLESLFSHVFPYGGRLDFEQGYLSSGPYGDIFDVITQEASPETLGSYGVVWPVGRLKLSRNEVRSLMDYVRGGGTLVVDTALADSFPPDFLGVRFKDRYTYGNQVQTAIAGFPPIGAPFRYQPMWVQRGSQVLAHTDDGSPLMAWRREGKGLVVASGTHHWVDETNKLLPVVPALLKSFTRSFLPVYIDTDVQMLVSRTPESWVIGLINNHGVSKVPTLPQTTDVAGTRDCLMRFRNGFPLRFTSRMGDFRWSNTSHAMSVRLEPGEVGVVEVWLGTEVGGDS